MFLITCHYFSLLYFTYIFHFQTFYAKICYMNNETYRHANFSSTQTYILLADKSKKFRTQKEVPISLRRLSYFKTINTWYFKSSLSNKTVLIKNILKQYLRRDYEYRPLIGRMEKTISRLPIRICSGDQLHTFGSSAALARFEYKRLID